MQNERKYFYEIFMIMLVFARQSMLSLQSERLFFRFCVLPVTSSLIVSIYLFRLTRQKRRTPVYQGGVHVDVKFKNKVCAARNAQKCASSLAQIARFYIRNDRLDVV